LEDPGIDGGIVKRHLHKAGWEHIDRIHLALDRGNLWVLVDMRMNLWVP
jgi:hypothetical protein